MKLFILLFTVVMGLSGFAQVNEEPDPGTRPKGETAAGIPCKNGKACPTKTPDGELSGRKGALTKTTPFTAECTLTDGTSKSFIVASNDELADAHKKFGCTEGSAKKSTKEDGTK